MITILVTVYNFENCILECLESIKCQSYRNWKALILDNASSDKSANSISEFIDGDERFELIVNTENTGPYPALNQMLNLVDTPYFTRVDGDDFIAPTYLEEAITQIDNYPDLNAVFTNFIYHPSGESIPYPSSIISKTPFSLSDILRDSLKVKGDYFSGSLNTFFRAIALCRTDVVKDLGGLKEWRTEADTLMWMQLACKGHVVSIETPLYHYRQTPNSVTSSVYSDSQDLFWKKKLLIELTHWLAQNSDFIEDPKQTIHEILKEYKGHMLYRLRKKRAWIQYVKTLISPAKSLE